MSPATTRVAPTARKVRLAPLGWLMRIAWPVMLVLVPGMMVALAFTNIVKKELLFGVAAVMFVAMLLNALAVEWMIRRELHRARTWTLSQAIFHDGEWYGLSDGQGNSHPHSPPIDELSAEIQTTAQRAQVLWNPADPRRIYFVQRPMALVRIET